MDKVISIRPKPTRPADCEKALALMQQARSLLQGLAESGQVEEGSPPQVTVDYLDNAIGMLSPDEEEVRPMVEQDRIDGALSTQRGILFQAMGIASLAALAAKHVASPVDGKLDQNTATDVWTALAGAQALLDGIASRLESTETLLA